MNNPEILELYGGKAIESVINEAKVMLETVVRRTTPDTTLSSSILGWHSH